MLCKVAHRVASAGQNVVPKQEDEAEAGGPGSASRLSLCPGGSAAASAVSAPRAGWTAPRQQQRLLSAAAAAPQPRSPAGCSAPAQFPPRHHPPTLLLNHVCAVFPSKMFV